jgi:NADPH:quinone reductase-like Zn-dependent oxidoreductase
MPTTKVLTPVEAVRIFLSNTTNPDVIRSVVAPDATYISLNYDDPELQKIMPWCGTKKGVEVFIDNFAMVWECWDALEFSPKEIFGSGEDVAVFGSFTYKSKSLGQTVTTPFSILAKVKNGMIYFFQFMEDTFATAGSFRIGGAGRFQSFPKNPPFEVGGSDTVATTMQAFVLAGNGPETLSLRTLAVPQPAENEVLIRTKAISLNPIDIAAMKIEGVRGGVYGDLKGGDIVIGWDVAGEVVASGAAVKGLKTGDRVFGCIKFPGQGRAYAEYVTAPADQLALIPEGVAYESAAAASMAAITPYGALVGKAKVSRNDKVLIHGAAGGVGHFAVQIAKSFGAYVIGTASTANLDFVKSIGADQVIDYKKDKFEDVVRDADLVLDAIDATNLLRSLDAVKKGGRVVSLKADFQGEIDQKAKAKGVTGIRFGVYSNGGDQQKIADLLASGKVRPVIFKTFAFRELPQAVAAMATVGYGKIVLTV